MVPEKWAQEVVKKIFQHDPDMKNEWSPCELQER